MARRISVEIVGDTRQLERSFGRAQKASAGFGRDMNRTFRGVVAGSGAFSALGRSVAFASTAFLGGVGFTAAAKSAVTAASDLNEEINKTSVVFAESSRGILSWSQTSAKALGLSRKEALGAAGAFGAMLHTTGIAGQAAAGMSKRMVELAADMASFNNQDPSEMLDRLRSGLAGEAEPLRRFGILLSEAAVQAEAVRIGLTKQGAKLTEGQKVLARYSLILRQTTLQQGDFARTSGGLANQQRILSATIADLQAKLGKALLPSLKAVTSAVTEWLSKSENQRKLQEDLKSAVEAVTNAFKVARDVYERVTAITHGLKNAIELALAAMAVAKVYAMTAAIAALGASTTGATAGLAKMRAGLAALAARSPWVLAVLVTVDPEISKSFRQTKIGKWTQNVRDAFDRLTAPLDELNKKLFGIANPNRVKSTLELAKAFNAVGNAIGAAADKFGPFQKIADTFAAVGDKFGPKPAKTPAAAATGGAAAKTFTLPGALLLAQARAQVTASINDDVAVAKQIVAHIRNILGTLKGPKLLGALGELASALDVVRGAAADRAAKAADALRKHADAVKEAAEKQRAAAAEAAQKIRAATENARQQIGALFQGPVLAPSDAQRKAQLGFPGTDPKTLVADLRAQTAQFLAFQKNLARLAQRGASGRLINELQQQGLSAAPQVAALAGAPAGVLSQFLKAFDARERAARRAAQRPLVVHTHLHLGIREIAEAVTTFQQRQGRQQGGQRRGNHGGQVLALG